MRKPFLSDITIDPVTGRFSRPMTVTEENELVARVKRGNRAAATLVVNLFEGFATTSTTKLCGALVGKSEFDDVLQEARMAILEAAKTFDPDRGSRLCTHLRWRVRNRVLTWKRKRMACVGSIVARPKDGPAVITPAIPLEAVEGELSAPEPGPGELLEAKDTVRELREQMANLPPTEQVLIEMRVLHKASQWETSQVTGIPERDIDGSVKCVLAKLRHSLTK